MTPFGAIVSPVASRFAPVVLTPNGTTDSELAGVGVGAAGLYYRWRVTAAPTGSRLLASPSSLVALPLHQDTAAGSAIVQPDMQGAYEFTLTASDAPDAADGRASCGVSTATVRVVATCNAGPVARVVQSVVTVPLSVDSLLGVRSFDGAGGEVLSDGAADSSEHGAGFQGTGAGLSSTDVASGGGSSSSSTSLGQATADTAS